MQPEDTVDGAQLGRLDQSRVGNHHGMQGPFELTLPKNQKFLQAREVRAQIVILPNIRLEQPTMVWTAVVDVRRGQTVALNLTHKVPRDHRCSLFESNIQVSRSGMTISSRKDE
jgi:hypothetical protein